MADNFGEQTQILEVGKLNNKLLDLDSNQEPSG
jgi:hypothetical protein